MCINPMHMICIIVWCLRVVVNEGHWACPGDFECAREGADDRNAMDWDNVSFSSNLRTEFARLRQNGLYTRCAGRESTMSRRTHLHDRIWTSSYRTCHRCGDKAKRDPQSGHRPKSMANTRFNRAIQLIGVVPPLAAEGGPEGRRAPYPE